MPLVKDRIQERLSDVAVGLLTPFDDGGEIAYGKLRSNARSLYDKGPCTFLATANISEFHSLSNEERITVTETSVDALPSSACVLAGVGGSTNTATELIQAYNRIGVDAMMIMPPDHTFIHEQGLLEYYRELGAVSERPLVPYVRGFEPSVEYLVALTELDSVVGIKYALEDTVKLGAAVEDGSNDVVWMNGLAEPFALSSWAEGAEGFSAGVSNFRPEVGLALFDALTDGDWKRARRLRNACLPYQWFRDETSQDNTIPGGSSVPALKKGLEMAGLNGGTVREPIQPLTTSQERRAEKLYEELDANIDRLIG